MITHAFFKALLFLGSGSVIHGMHDEQDMRRMGALRKWMPVTAATFIIGWLAIAGVPPFAGFWSKDEILVGAWDKSPALWAVGFVTAILTAYYMTRQVIMVFFGEAKWEEARPEPDPDHSPADATGDDHHAFKPHESPWIMLLPLVVLAVLSTIGGALNLPTSRWLDHWLEPVVGDAERTLTVPTSGKWVLVLLTTAVVMLGIFAAWVVYQRKRVKAFEPAILEHGWYYDEAVSAFMGGPGRESFEAAAWFDANIVDGAVNGTATVVKESAGVVRKSESGYVRGYAAVIGVGVVLVLGWFLFKGLV
jgi:NADH-quinone oxidoreductase subunit L